MVYLMGGIVFVIFALPTAGGANSDNVWVKEVRKGKEAGCHVAARYGITEIVWMGDFNFEPERISGKPDPRRSSGESENVVAESLWVR